MLVAIIHCRLDRQDGVLVVTVPLHALVVYIVGAFHCDELLVHCLCNLLHYRRHGKMHRFRDSAVTGMALMRTTIFPAEQGGINCDRTATGVQKGQLIGQREKVFTGIFEYGAC